MASSSRAAIEVSASTLRCFSFFKKQIKVDGEGKIRTHSPFTNINKTQHPLQKRYSILDWTPIGKRIAQGRWVVVLEKNITKTVMRNAHYVWLKGNPSFLFIPPDYVIHHLDGDPLNDDITNLVIMQKHYHISYHAKKIWS
jgi:hypothetical protein